MQASKIKTMHIHAIHTQADYKAALKEVSTLIDIDPAVGTEQADRLEVLGTLVEVYEAKYYIFDSTSGNKYAGYSHKTACISAIKSVFTRKPRVP